MILSDERFAVATIVEGPRGPEPRLFDDYNCQVEYELAHARDEIVARWARSYATSEWVAADEAWFVMSPALRTPMGSQTAAFASRDEAERANAELEGDVVAFDAAWRRLGFMGGACEDEHDAEESAEGDGGGA